MNGQLAYSFGGVWRAQPTTENFWLGSFMTQGIKVYNIHQLSSGYLFWFMPFIIS